MTKPKAPLYTWEISGTFDAYLPSPVATFIDARGTKTAVTGDVSVVQRRADGRLHIRYRFLDVPAMELPLLSVRFA